MPSYGSATTALPARAAYDNRPIDRVNLSANPSTPGSLPAGYPPARHAAHVSVRAHARPLRDHAAGGRGLDVRDAYVRTPDLADVARSMGAEGERVEALQQLDALPERLRELCGPLVLDWRVMRVGVGI
jgi:hypothetical protein